MKKLIYSILIILIIVFLLSIFVIYKLPLSEKTKTITIASWNLKNIGKSKLNDPERINIIINIIKDYDIIAIQEVKDVSLQLPNQLVAMINKDGNNYQVVTSDRVGRNVLEQYLFIYDDNVIDF